MARPIKVVEPMPASDAGPPTCDAWIRLGEASFFEAGLVAAAIVAAGKIRFASTALHALLGRDLLETHDIIELVAGQDRDQVEEELRRSSRSTVPTTLRCSLVHTEGRAVPVELRLAAASIHGECAVLVLVHDLTDRVAAEERLSAIAHYDALTGLPNRLLLQDRLTQGFAAATRNNRLLGLLVIDLDGFKSVNDRFGHATGDEVLRQVAVRFSNCVRTVDTLARVGGDEFVAVLPDLTRREDAGVIAARLVNSIRAEFACDGMSATVGASIGIALFPDDGRRIDKLFAHADAAMYSAKRAGKNRYAFAGGSSTVVLAADRCEWSDEWRLGNESMDADHEALFELLNDLGSALAQESNEAHLRTRLRHLVEFCARHFVNEERIMSAARLDVLESHRAEHQRLLVDLSELAEHTHWVGASLTMRFLRNWLAGHIQTYDRIAADALKRPMKSTSPSG